MRQRFLCSRSVSYLLFAAAILCGGFLFTGSVAHAATEPLSSTPLISDPNLVSYYPFDADANDTMGINNGTTTGSASFSGSGEFSDALSLPGNSTSEMHAGNTDIPRGYPFSVSAWVNRDTGGGSGFETIASLWNGYGSGTGWIFFISPSGYLGFQDYTIGSGNQVITTTSSISTGSGFHHVAITLAGGTAVFYVDGSPIQTISIPNENPTVTQGLEIGNSNANTATLYFSGLIDDVSIFSRALTGVEVSGLYTGSWPPPPSGLTTIELYSTPLFYDANLVSYYRFESNANDAKAINNGTLAGSAGYSSSGEFGDALSVPGGASSEMHAGNTDIPRGYPFTISAWIERNTGGGAGGEVIASLWNGYGSGTGWFFFLSTSGHLGFQSYQSGLGAQVITTTSSIATGSGFHHVAVVLLGSGATFYVDGVEIQTISVADEDPSVSSNFEIGNTNADSSNLYFSGLIDDVAVFSRALTSGEIANIYSGGWPVVFPEYLQQYKSDATTTISEGSNTTESTVVLGAKLESSATSTEQLQVEVEPTGTSFTGTANATSSFVSPGTSVTVRYGNEDSTYGLSPESSSDGSYHWQARIVNSNGATSTWQIFGPTATSTDFVINTVPLYTQIGSIYPSFASTSVVDGGWGGDTYFDGTAYCDGGNKIGYCGCAITSVAMDLRYFGIATDTLGNPIDPRNLNTWLTDNGGYIAASGTTDGDLEWDMIPYYATPPGGGVIALDPNSGTGYGTTLSEMSSEINSLFASSTPTPAILVEPGHFVVATGIAQNNGTSTYTIRDSAWYLTQYLNETTSTDTSSTIYGYNNSASGVFIYYDPATHPLIDDFAINLPNSLMLVDSSGRRTGKDPVTGIMYHEIPGTSYFEGESSGQLYFTVPPKGQYMLYILGGTTGQYYLNSWIADGGPNPPKRQVFSGNVQKGSMVAYIQNYNMTNIVSSTPFFYTVATSTAIITTARPNNLPPPLVSIVAAKSVTKSETITRASPRISTSTASTTSPAYSSFPINLSSTSSVIINTSTIKY